MLLLGFFLLNADAQIGMNSSDFSAWKSERTEFLRALKNRSRDEAIPELYLQVYKLNNQSKSPETSDLLEEALIALTSFNGYADYYREKLNALRSEYAKTGVLNGTAYSNAQLGISRMRYVQTPEIVASLGAMVNDPEGRNGKTLRGDSVTVPDGDFSATVNCEVAADALFLIGIEKPPARGPLLYATKWQQIDAWKDWWNEIAAGKRTYRFIGSPVEYGPDGPVSAKEISRREHDRQSSPRTGNVGTQEVTSTPESPGIGSKVVAGVAIVLLAAGGWFAFGKRKGVA